MNNNEKKLLDTIKNVCTNRKCPEWIKNTFIKTIEEINQELYDYVLNTLVKEDKNYME